MDTGTMPRSGSHSGYNIQPVVHACLVWQCFRSRATDAVLPFADCTTSLTPKHQVHEGHSCCRSPGDVGQLLLQELRIDGHLLCRQRPRQQHHSRRHVRHNLLPRTGSSTRRAQAS